MAHWIIEDKGFGGQVYTCSHCKNSWNDLYNPTVGQWDICPWCHEKIDEEVDAAKLESALKKIADAASKIKIPKLDVKMFDVSAFKGHIEALLSPCPFCGGTAKIKKDTQCGGHGEYYKVKYVECTSCGTSTRRYACDGYYGMTMTDEELADKWNRRV